MNWNSAACLFEVECRDCKGTGEYHPGGGCDPDWCSGCGGCGDDFIDPWPIVHNIVVAGALTYAYRLGMLSMAFAGQREWRSNADGLADLAAVEALTGASR